MKLFNRIFLFGCLISFLVSCKKNDEQTSDQTILTGSADVYVDETLLPIMEAQVQIFESLYDAKIKLTPKSEAEVFNDLLNKKSQIAVLSKNLSKKEIEFFQSKKIYPKITPFAVDAIALITNKSVSDTLIDLQQVVDFLNKKPNTKISKMVFDNPNSSTVRYMLDLAKIKELPNDGVFSFKTNNEVIKFVSENPGSIGVIGLNWIADPSSDMETYIDKLNVLSVKGLNSNIYASPTQNDIAEQKYPLTRDIFIINCQGFSGLGMGFASFISGDKGQRIVLKSGLMPVRVPGRKMMITNEFEKDIKN